MRTFHEYLFILFDPIYRQKLRDELQTASRSRETETHTHTNRDLNEEKKKRLKYTYLQSI